MNRSYSKRKKESYLKYITRLSLLLFLIVFFCSLWIPKLRYISESSRLNDSITQSAEFRCQPVDEQTAEVIRDMKDPGEYLAVYWLESRFGETAGNLSPDESISMRKRWERADGWGEYLSACQSIWDDLVYFPVASSENAGFGVSFEDSWMFDRTYKGERGHEGTDIMAEKNERGVLPVVSMTDGVVQNKGWLELGGYRVGIRTPRGAYFYYAHLDSYADIEEGDEIKAGDLLGFMGDTGYGTREGTKGKFPVHLHLGIYVYSEGEEISVNPYPALKYVEEKKIDYQGR